MTKKFYLAYGSNLNMAQMKIRCPGAKVYGETVLEDSVMTFRSHNARGGVANIERCKGNQVRAMVYTITSADEEELDIYEGFPFLYYKKDIEVKVGGKAIKAMIYLMEPEDYPLAAPSHYYTNVIAQGYLDVGWPTDEFYSWVKRNFDMIDASYLGKVKQQILAIRDTGVTNMFDRRMVQSLAIKREYWELDSFIVNQPVMYTNFIFNGKF